MGNGSADFALLNHTSAVFNGSAIQSLPDFDNPCERIWARYFSNSTAHSTWFTGKHNVSYSQMIIDCNNTVAQWQAGVMQIR
jgi:hypothetical protein